MHEGHRKRMYAKLESGDNLFDHELLEILLYSVYPRVNTNPVAHALLARFCSLSEVLTASIDELKTVEGVGDNVALFLRCVGECASRACFINGVAELKNYGDIKRFTALRMRGKTEEVLEFYLLEKDGRVKRIYDRTSNDISQVKFKASDLVKLLAAVKPYGLVAAHNHPGGFSEPSEKDDLFTKQVQLICSMNGIVFYDHCIYSPRDGVFSYHESGRIDTIKEEYSLDSVLGKWITDSK